ncbi:hypothetical protein PDE_04824 [Penicillium oxalicum 114-2]|uniref:Uncharacterized protein n=1 Tax=Penicillium oxalicum (strain 114-2 / CGMCC 5302) TaxID=933388 RepID=S7ZHZ4_PENO1|nr:hypothetical protein PDE_04824 [Penicillium oxalicum 114-2]
MAQSPFHVDDTLHSSEPQPWGYVPTPGYFGSPYATRSISSPSPSSVLQTGIERTSRPGPDSLRFIQLSEWEEGRAYQADPPTCIHYQIEWRVTINNREVSQDTEEDLTLAPSSFWPLSLEKKLEKVLRRKTSRHRRVTANDTVITVLTSDRTKRKLTKRFNDTDIIWTAIEKQLVMWSDVLFRGKELTPKISFNYINDRRSSPTWKKHYPPKSHHIKRLIAHVKKGGVLEGHKDMPEAVRDELYREEHKRPSKGKRKGGHVDRSRAPYPPININILPSQSTIHGIDVSTSKAAVDLTALSPLEIPGATDIAVKEYTEWLVSTVERDTLKAAFRQTCEVMLENGLDLEQVYKDQDPNFFIERGIKIGIARRFVENIAKWVKEVKQGVRIHEIL